MKQALMLIGIVTLLVGCVSVQTNAGKTLATTAITVDGAMQGWAAWVAQGQATADQEAKVKKAYAQYQASMSVALAAYNTLVTSGDQNPWIKAASVMAANQDALLKLTQLFIQGGTPK